MAARLTIAERFGPMGGTVATTRYQHLLPVAPASKAESRRVHRVTWLCVTIKGTCFSWKLSGVLNRLVGFRIGPPLVIG